MCGTKSLALGRSTRTGSTPVCRRFLLYNWSFSRFSDTVSLSLDGKRVRVYKKDPRAATSSRREAYWLTSLVHRYMQLTTFVDPPIAQTRVRLEANRIHSMVVHQLKGRPVKFTQDGRSLGSGIRQVRTTPKRPSMKKIQASLI